MALKRVLIIHPDARSSERFSSPLLRSGEFAVRVAHTGFDVALMLVRESFDGIVIHPGTAGMDLRRTISEIRMNSESKDAGLMVIHGPSSCPDQAVLQRAGGSQFCTETEPGPDVLTKVRQMTGLEVPAAAPKEPTPPPTKQAAPTPPPVKPTAQVERVVQPQMNPPTQPEKTTPEGDKLPAQEDAPKPVVTIQDKISRHLSLAAREGADLYGLPPRVSRLDFLIPDMRGDLVSKEVLSIDINLAVTVLRMANSIIYGTRSPIVGLGRALTRLGQRAVANHYLETWKAREAIPPAAQGVILNDTWRHNLMVACLCEEIGRYTKQGSPDTYFSAGLLHDVGKMLMLQHYPNEYLDIRHKRMRLELMSSGLVDVGKIETRVLGTDHGMLGYELCQGWNLPSVVSVGTLHHHVGAEGPWMKIHPKITRAVAIADLLDHHVERLERVLPPNPDDHYRIDPATGEVAVSRPEPRDVPYLRISMRSRKSHRGTVPMTALQAFPPKSAPEWVPEYIEALRLPVVRVYERAQRRMHQATVQAGMQAA